MAAIVYLLAAAVSAFVWSRAALPWITRPVRWLSGMVIMSVLVLLPVQALATLELLRWIGAIHLWALATVQVVMLAALLLWARKAQKPDHRDMEHRRSATLVSSSLPSYLWFCAALLTVSYLVFACNLFTSYPSGSDALTYHLPVALHWLQNGSLRIPSLSAWQYGLPGNAEIGMMLFLSTGHETLVPLVNVFVLVLFGLATYEIAMRVSRGNKMAAVAVTVMALSMPIVEFQSFSGYVDLFGSAFLITAVALFLARNDGVGSERAKLHRRTMLLLSALACGVSIGTKPVFYVYAAVYCLAVAITLMRESGLLGREFAGGMAVVVAGVLLPSVFWFGRGLAATGNPLFPMQVKVGQRVLLKGFAPSEITASEFSDKFVRQRAEWIIYPWTEYLRNPGEQLIPYSEGSGTGAAFAAFVPLGLLFAMFRAGSRRSGTTETILLATWIGLAVVWWTSLQRMPRFGLPLLAVACVLSAPLVVVLQEFAGRGFAMLLVVCVVATCGISAFVPLREIGGRLKNQGWSRSHVYGYPALVDDMPPGTTLLNNTGDRDANFTLAGRKLTNRVIADFEVPNPITPAFLAQRHVDFVVEAAQPNGEKTSFRLTAQFTAGNQESTSANAGGKRWTFWTVERPANATGNRQ